MAANSPRPTGIFAVLALLAVASCAAQTNQPSQANQLPLGAVTASAAYPPIGAKWQIRITDNTNGSVRELTVTAAPVDFDGQPAYGLSSASGTSVLNPTTFNYMATMRDGKVANTSLPDSGQYSWPLWVGKSWTTTYNFNDAERGFRLGRVVRYTKVAAYEEVSVPAGTFKAFRIEQTPGMNEAVNIASWYAPDARMIVKTIFQRTSNHYLGSGQTTTELLTIPK